MLKKWVLLCFCFLTTTSYAALDETSSVIIKIYNDTNSTLYFNGTSSFNATNTISMTDTTIAPGHYTKITGTTSYADDFVGNVHFLDEAGYDNIFIITDHRQFHAGTPVFAMGNKRITSDLLSVTLNTDPNPRSLGYSAAEVELDPTA